MSAEENLSVANVDHGARDILPDDGDTRAKVRFSHEFD
jgi:hypothetical protein